MLKKTHKILILLFMAVLLFSTFCYANDAVVTSLEPDTVETISESEEEAFHNSDLYEINENITVNKLVDGNVFLLGDTVTIGSDSEDMLEIGGDIFVCANTLNIKSSTYVYGSIFAVANNITIDGIAYDVYALSQNITIGENGIIVRDAKISAASITINGIIRRDAYFSAENINFPEGTKSHIEGDLNYSSANELSIPEGVILGNTNYTAITETAVSTSDIIKNYATNIISSLLYTLVFVLLVLWLTPKFVEKASNIIVKKHILTLVIGLFALIIIPVLCILLMFTTLFSGLAFAIFAIYILILTVCNSITSIAVGKLLANKLNLTKTWQFVLLTLLVSAIIWAIKFVPYIGSTIALASPLIGFGIFILGLFTKKAEVN